MIDSHIHLTHRLYDQGFPYLALEGEEYRIRRGNLKSLIEEMRAEGISCCIEPAIEAASNDRLLKLAGDYEGFVFPAVGNHPTRCLHSPWGERRRIRELSGDPRVIAIGETGLDYHHPRREQHRLRQWLWFVWQIRLADEKKLPLMLHIREADEAALRVLRRNKKRLHGGVCHCFTGPLSLAKVYTEELGLCLGIGGSLLGPPEKSASLCEAVEQIPLSFLLLETDGPYVKPLRPESFSGKEWQKARNTSLILPAVAERIAGLKQIPVETVLAQTEENTRRVFGLETLTGEACHGIV